MPGPLAAKVRAKYPAVYDDLDDASLEKAILAKHPEYADLAQPEPQQAPSAMDMGLADQPNQTNLLVRGTLALARGIKQHPVEAGAIGGSTLAAGATGGLSLLPQIAAAILGGGLGAGGGQIASGQRPDLGTMVSEGIGQGIGHGVGGAISKVAGKLAPKVLKGVLKPTGRLQDEFGDLVGIMQRERIPIGQSAKAGERMSESASNARQMVADAEAAGAAPIKPKEVTSGLRDVAKVTKQRVQLGKPDETPEVVARGTNLYRANKNGIPLTKAQELKTRAQQDASSAFRSNNPALETGALMDKSIATGLKQAIESRVPAVGPVNARTQDLIGLKDALETAEQRSGSGLINFNPMSWGALGPGLTSRAGFKLGDVSKAPVAGTGRNLAAILSALFNQQPQEP